jgi:pilus assembly protein Flp/PilA
MAHVKLDLTTPAPRDERGATATEYGLLVGFIALAIVIGVTAFGTALDGFFGRLATAVNGLIP